MKKIALVGALLVCNLVANDGFQGNMNGDLKQQQSSEKFQEIKTKMLERQNQHLKMVQSNIDCVKRADSMSDLKICRKEAQEKMKQFKEQFSNDKGSPERMNNSGSNKMNHQKNNSDN